MNIRIKVLQTIADALQSSDRGELHNSTLAKRAGMSLGDFCTVALKLQRSDMIEGLRYPGLDPYTDEPTVNFMKVTITHMGREYLNRM